MFLQFREMLKMSSLFINYILCDQEKNPTAAVALNKKEKCYNSRSIETLDKQKNLAQ